MRRYTHPLFHEPAAAPGPAITAAILQQAEARLGVQLPAAYTRCLQEANGGPLRRRILETPQGELAIRDLLGLGYDEGVDGQEGSAALAEEWGYPPGTLVLSFEGRCALLLDYRTPQREPQVIWIDTDTDEQRLIADNMADFLRQLRYPMSDTQIALHQDDVPDIVRALALCQRLGAQGTPREEWTGAIVFPSEDGRVRVRPNRHRGAVVVPELAQVAWILEVKGLPEPAVLETVLQAAPQSVLLTPE